MWKRRKFDGGSDLEAGLRSYRASAPEELVDRVSHRITGERRVPQRAWSRVAFASAVAVFMLGTFASFGGLSYAASGADGAYHAVKAVPTGHLHFTVQKSSATAQYAPTPKPPKTVAPKQTQGVAGAQATLPTTATKTSGSLPFTGLSLATTAILSLVLIAAGLLLRRRERQS